MNRGAAKLDARHRLVQLLGDLAEELLHRGAGADVEVAQQPAAAELPAQGGSPFFWTCGKLKLDSNPGFPFGGTSGT